MVKEKRFGGFEKGVGPGRIKKKGMGVYKEGEP